MWIQPDVGSILSLGARDDLPNAGMTGMIVNVGF